MYSVAGNFDLVAIVRVAHNDDLADLITRNLNDVDGITHRDPDRIQGVLQARSRKSLLHRNVRRGWRVQRRGFGRNFSVDQ